jgi:2-dehydro-3-deoxyphosphooctonate aldolase (KDO 8-P synthase)
MAISPVKTVRIGSVTLGDGGLPVVIAGLCVLENQEHAVATAQRLKSIAADAGFQYIFKASYDKANRTSLESYRGPGLEAGLAMLAAVRADVGVPVLTDVHREEDVEKVAAVVDCIQVPAFLCRQTDLLRAVAQSGKTVNVKKGQFMAPGDMRQALGKITGAGTEDIVLTERGASFGYRNLVVDMRSLVIMRETGYPVVFDATHSVQLPSGGGTSSGGDRQFVPPLVRAAAAVGIDGLFLETHECPDKALCDGPNSLAIDDLPGLLGDVERISAALSA